MSRDHQIEGGGACQRVSDQVVAHYRRIQSNRRFADLMKTNATARHASVRAVKTPLCVARAVVADHRPTTHAIGLTKPNKGKRLGGFGSDAMPRLCVRFAIGEKWGAALEASRVSVASGFTPQA